ncbi:PIG-L family deacetylase [Fulvimarina endophytica]|uniref:PIG-L family deacetylase n=1 Tax=Fulvimarina endophytica TaxID=2293836 RepID=A0A371X9R2_9HYPH|nr:PIG-L family deacetylase [Fulvimarina endophytica]RFC65941.1 PIG-L family deacetylase [Fulvimarina endophytica]
MNGSVDELLDAGSPLLVLAPHPDDESLACGLLLAERWLRGIPTHVACVTDGSASHPGSSSFSPSRLAALRHEELLLAVRCLGGDPVRDVTWMGHPDAASHRVHAPGSDLARDVCRLVDRLGAKLLLTASSEDPHCDHVACADAAHRVATARPSLRMWSYAVWSRWHDWSKGREAAGLPLDLPRRREAKRAAIRAHRSQMGFVVSDDPEGFRMPPGFADRFCAAPEIFLQVAP